MTKTISRMILHIDTIAKNTSRFAILLKIPHDHDVKSTRLLTWQDPMRPWWRKLLWFCWSRERARTAGSWGGWSAPRWRSTPSCWGWCWWGGPSPPSADTQCQPPAKPESYVAGSSLKLAVEATLLDTAIIFTTFTFQHWLQNLIIYKSWAPKWCEPQICWSLIQSGGCGWSAGLYRAKPNVGDIE